LGHGFKSQLTEHWADFLQNPQEYREGQDHIIFEIYKEKPINWNADPIALAQLVLIGGYGIEDICIWG
jgi:hypothetical protein